MCHIRNLYQYLATFSAILHMVSFGVHEGWTSAYLPQGEQTKNTTTTTINEESAITLTFFCGLIIGALISFLLTDKFGRKITILLTSVIYFTSFLALGYSNSILTLCIIRIIAGIGGGLTFTVLPLYIGEISNPKIRGALITYMALFSLLGFFSVNLMGSYLSVLNSSLIFLTLPIAVTLIFMWMPESPYYLIMTQNFQEAKNSLMKFNNKNDIESDFARLKLGVESSKGSFFDIFRKTTNRKALFMHILVINSVKLSGEDVFVVYTQPIFANFVHKVPPTLMVAVYYTVKVIMTVVSSFLIDKFGRRKLLFLSLSISGVIFLCLGIYLLAKIDSEYFAVVLLIFFAIFYSVLTPVPVILMGELYTINVKTFSSLLLVVYLCVVTMVVIYFYEVVSKNFGTDIVFFCFSGVCIAHLGLVFLFLLETKGKTLEEIQNELSFI